MKSVHNAIASLKQIDEVLDILQGKKEYTNGEGVEGGFGRGCSARRDSMFGVHSITK